MNVKKILCVIATMFAISTSVYAIELSVGASVGLGAPLFKDLDTDLDTGLTSIPTLDEKSKLYYKFQLDVLIEFNPFFALETGFGFSGATMTQSYTSSSTTYESEYKYTPQQVYLPVMARGQIGYNGIADLYMVTYGAAGAKVGLPVGNLSTYKIKSTVSSGDTATTYDGKAENNSFMVLDVAIAVGQEVRLGNSHYVGLRIGFDIGIFSYESYSDGDSFSGADDYFGMNNFNFAVTYRYSLAGLF